MMGMLWGDIERDLASSRHHFTMAVDLFPDLRGASPGRDHYVRVMAFLLGFRHVATHVYDEFDVDQAALAVENARTYLAGVEAAVTRFRAVVDPDR